MHVDDLKYMKAQSKAYVSLKEDILDVMDYKRPIKTFDLAVPPYEYQRAAADLLLNVKGLLLGMIWALAKQRVEYVRWFYLNRSRRFCDNDTSSNAN